MYQKPCKLFDEIYKNKCNEIHRSLKNEETLLQKQQKSIECIRLIEFSLKHCFNGKTK
jgi:hypothetical protein